MPTLPLGAATVSNDLVFTTLYNGELVALNRATGAIVYQAEAADDRRTPPSRSPATRSSSRRAAGTGAVKGSGGSPQLVAYTVP